MRIILIILLDFLHDFAILLELKSLSTSYVLLFLLVFMATTITTDASFSSDIASGLALVDFWAEWCGPCQIMLPRLEELSGKVADQAKVLKMDVDANPGTPGQFRIMSIPTLILFKDGQPVEKWVGVQDVATLEGAIAKHA